MIRVIYDNKIYEVSEVANLDLYQLACQILLAAGFFTNMEILKHLAIFLSIKEDRLVVEYVQDAVGRRRKIDYPVLLFSGIMFLGVREPHFRSFEKNDFENVVELCTKNGRIVQKEDAIKWLKKVVLVCLEKCSV